MENLYVERTRQSLEIDFNTNGTLKLSGKSFPENTFEIYAPMMRWIKEYLTNCSVSIITVNLNIEYCNSSSTMLLFDLFDLLLENNNNNNNIITNWYYDEENDIMEEIGADIIEEFPELNIKLIEINSIKNEQ